MATDAATNPAKRDLDFEYDFVSIILQFQTKNDTKLYNICHNNRCKDNVFCLSEIILRHIYSKNRILNLLFLSLVFIGNHTVEYE